MHLSRLHVVERRFRVAAFCCERDHSGKGTAEGWAKRAA
jgi:hypothetical protein